MDHRRDLAGACTKLSIARFSPNDLRRTHASWLRAEGIEPQLIGAAMGRCDSRMVERVYGRLTSDALAKLLAERVTRPVVTKNLFAGFMRRGPGHADGEHTAPAGAIRG